jgi:hypothetical protein
MICFSKQPLMLRTNKSSNLLNWRQPENCALLGHYAAGSGSFFTTTQFSDAWRRKTKITTRKPIYGLTVLHSSVSYLPIRHKLFIPIIRCIVSDNLLKDHKHCVAYNSRSVSSPDLCPQWNAFIGERGWFALIILFANAWGIEVIRFWGRLYRIETW